MGRSELWSSWIKALKMKLLFQLMGMGVDIVFLPLVLY